MNNSKLKKQQTLSILKPDAVSKRKIGQILSRFEDAGLKIIAARLLQLSKKEAEQFYSIHNNRVFFNDLVNFMISGPIFVQVLEGFDAIQKNRDLMGDTDPKKAIPGSIRFDFSDSIEANAVHGSDSLETAKFEISFFFPEINIYNS
ncbi:MAG: nucleoside-diphosphate kinase [Bordetella sp.]|nr:MAG: nucleoside-diphosphate kinase [Bordetella sp.]